MKNTEINMNELDICCPICESKMIDTQSELEQFEYGTGPKKALINVYIPINKCAACEFEFVGEKASNLRHDAVCRHLGLLTPSEIQELRVSLTGSQKGFADLSHLGIATIQRWEQGQILQTKSNDAYLRLLKFPENVERLKKLNNGEKMASASTESSQANFKGNALDQKAVLQLTAASQSFSLKRKVG